MKGIVAILVFLAVMVYMYFQTSVEITPEQARKNVAKGEYDYIVDVRTKPEWDAGHLDQSISIPIGTFVTELPQKIPNTDARILFVCRKGIRATAVATMAQKLGYSNVHAMQGNYAELKE
jgi:phage shock protein E